MTDNTSTFHIDIPLSCSLFLEPALARYHKHVSPISQECTEYIHEWNTALTNMLHQPKYNEYLGNIARKLLSRQKNTKYIPSCIEYAQDAKMYALHYAIRFSESIRFLTNKIDNIPDLKFIDFGCGLSPLAAMTQTSHPNTQAYCIDFPYIADIYDNVARMVGGAQPEFISWDAACKMAADKNNRMNALIAMGVFHYMPIKEQIQNLKFVNKNFQSFMIEIKYKTENSDTKTNAFDLKTLQKLRIDIPHVDTIETAMLANSMRYLHTYRTTLPKYRSFVENVRSLFLSR